MELYLDSALVSIQVIEDTTDTTIGLSSPLSTLIIYPVPTTSTLQISLGDLKVDWIRLMTIDGRDLIRVNSVNKTHIRIPVDELAAGIYLLEFQYKGQKIFTKKIVKQE